MNWIDSLQSALSQRADKIPPGFERIEAISKQWGVPESTARSRLNNLCTRGILERKKFLAIMSNGSVRSVPFFRVIAKRK